MILVTGGTGLVGSHLLFKLTDKGIKVRATYRRTSTIDRVKTIFSYYSKNHQDRFESIEWVKANLNDIAQLSKAFVGITHVYHCAALISFDPSDYRQLRQTNIKGTANIVNLCIDHKIQKLCYVSSIASLGYDSRTINEETHWQGNQDQNVYAISKFGAEMEVWRGTQEGVPAVIVNPGVIIGPGFWTSGSGLLFKLAMKKQPFYTNSITGYVGVYDVVDALIKLMHSDIANERFVLVGENKSYREVMTDIARSLKVKPPSKFLSGFKLQLAWRIDWIMSKCLGRKRRLTKSLSRSLNKSYHYDNSKIEQTIAGFKFQPIAEVIRETSQFFLTEVSSSKFSA